MTASRFPDAPPNIRRLKVDRRGYPIPWFVAYFNGEPDFRVIRPAGVFLAAKNDTCWICGRKLGRLRTFAVGPMGVINRISSEPPSHPECATFAATACPFLTTPGAKRREANMPEVLDPAGIMHPRNPGVTCLWSTQRFTAQVEPGGGMLFDLGQPRRISWYAEGRPATRAEAEGPMRSGLPILEAAPDNTSETFLALARAFEAALLLLPAV